ncbi:Protein GrpE [Vitis vinifera]|uniref:Protein GrpE n=1 Tax=Vitis vinifera TaxID=29760 RepID=A0A438CBH7_VITVI|nr:Protein GrpE [Vitis vinifera]RVW89861.1 Protein GrpE [Vitis vinifera]
MLNSPVGNHVHVGVSMVKHNERVHDMKTLISHTIQPHGLHKHSSFVLDDALSLFPTMNTGIWCQTTEILSQHWKTAINVIAVHTHFNSYPSWIDGYIGGAEDATSDSDAPDSDAPNAEEEPASGIIVALRSYKEALVSNDESKAAEIEAFIKFIEDEKIDLEKKVAALSEELSSDKERILRISADFDNFRKRTDRERLSLVTNAQGEVLENLLPVLDNFERAKAQIKVETEGEEKINNSYQSIYKQFVEILGSLGVTPVETIGNPFDPLVSFRAGSKFSLVLDELSRMLYQFHEAIMREDSTEFEEDVIIQEFRKGFKLGDRLLRPSMVKVSAGPGPAKAEAVGSSEEEAVRVTETETSGEGTPEGESG